MVLAGTTLFAFYATLAGFALLIGFGLPVVLTVSVLFAGVQYKLGKYVALRSVGASDLPEAEHPEIHATIESLAADLDIEKPRVMSASMGVPNAFAVGRSGAGVVVLGNALIELLPPDELRAIIAHEMAHLSNRDAVLMVIGQSLLSMIISVVYRIDRLVEGTRLGRILDETCRLAGLSFAVVFVYGYSRCREYAADTAAARVTDDPEALARALIKLHQFGEHEHAPDVEGNVCTLCIFDARCGMLGSLTDTHPPIEKRIGRLTPEIHLP